MALRSIVRVGTSKTTSSVLPRASALTTQSSVAVVPLSPVVTDYPRLIAPSVREKRTVLSDPRFVQAANSEECQFVAGLQMVNYNSDRGYVSRSHGQAWALQQQRFSLDHEEITSMKFRLDHHDVAQMIDCLTKYYSMPQLLKFALTGKSGAAVIEMLKELMMNDLPQFQFLASAGGHAYAVHEMGPDRRLLTTGIASGVGTYLPTMLVQQGQLTGSCGIPAAVGKAIFPNLQPSYGFVSAADLKAAYKNSPNKRGRLIKLYPALESIFEKL